MYAGESFVAPIIFTLENTTPIGKPVTLFMPSENRGQPNSGLPAGVVLNFNYNTTPYGYTQLLADADNESSFQIWKFRYNQISPIVNAPIPPVTAVPVQLNEIFYVTYRQTDGDGSNSPLQPYVDIDQTAYNAREFRENIIIDSDIGIKFFLHAFHKLEFYFWIDKNISKVNKITTGESKHYFSKPFPLEAKNPYLVRIIYKSGSVGFME
jgi:hypothetical protein